MQGESDGMRIGFAALSVQGLYGVSYPSGNGTERKTASTPAKGVEGKPFGKVLPGLAVLFSRCVLNSNRLYYSQI